MGTQSTALAPREKTANLRKLLDMSKEQIALALPRHLTPERMIRVGMTAVQRQPKLLECEQVSIIGSIIEASQLGLEPDGILGQAYLVPFWNGKTKRMECQLQVGYRGYIFLARRSGEVSSLYSELVYSHDYIEITKGDKPSLKHRPAYFDEDRGDLIGAYAVVSYKDGGSDFEFMPMSELNKVRAMSKAKDREGHEYGPWTSHPEEMYRKVPIRRLAKRLPLSPEFMKAAVVDEYGEAGVQHAEVEVDSFSETAMIASQNKARELMAKYAPPEEEEAQDPQQAPGQEPTAVSTPDNQPPDPEVQKRREELRQQTEAASSRRGSKPTARRGAEQPGVPLSFTEEREPGAEG